MKIPVSPLRGFEKIRNIHSYKHIIPIGIYKNICFHPTLFKKKSIFLFNVALEKIVCK